MNARGRTQFAPTEKDREHKNSLSFFHTPCPARYSVLHLLGVLSGGNEPPFTQGSLWFVRHESLSDFLDKHCFCGHKSDAPREAGQIKILIKLFYDDFFSRCFIAKTETSQISLAFSFSNVCARFSFFIHRPFG